MVKAEMDWYLYGNTISQCCHLDGIETRNSSLIIHIFGFSSLLFYKNINIQYFLSYLAHYSLYHCNDLLLGKLLNYLFEILV